MTGWELFSYPFGVVTGFAAFWWFNVWGSAKLAEEVDRLQEKSHRRLVLAHHANVRDHGSTPDLCGVCAEINEETFRLYTGEPDKDSA